MNAAASTLTQKIQSLTDEQIVEVEIFVEFVRLRQQERGFTHLATRASSPAFEAIWDNPEDAAYDAFADIEMGRWLPQKIRHIFRQHRRTVESPKQRVTVEQQVHF